MITILWWFFETVQCRLFSTQWDMVLLIKKTRDEQNIYKDEDEDYLQTYKENTVYMTTREP